MSRAVEEARQEVVDRFYFTHGAPCCAGCDWWRHINSIAGECRRSAPVASADRWGLIGISAFSLPLGAGHVITPRDHSCGEFRDSFDWSSLPPPYRRKVGAPLAATVARAAQDGENRDG